MSGYMRQAMIPGYITECSETAVRNAGKSGAAAFLNAGKDTHAIERRMAGHGLKSVFRYQGKVWGIMRPVCAAFSWLV